MTLDRFRKPDAAQCAGRKELAGLDAGHGIGPADVIESLDGRSARDLQAKARLAGTLLEHEVPAGIAARPLHLVDGQIEAEEV